MSARGDWPRLRGRRQSQSPIRAPLERLLDGGVVPCFLAHEAEPEPRGKELQLESAVVAQAVLVDVRRPLGGNHRRQVLGVLGGHGALHLGAVRDAERADLAVRPALSPDPFAGVIAVFGLVDEVVVLALGVESAPAIHDDSDVSAFAEVFRMAAVVDVRLVVWGALHDARPSSCHGFPVDGREIEVRRQANAVSHRHHDVFRDQDSISRFRKLVPAALE